MYHVVHFWKAPPFREGLITCGLQCGKPVRFGFPASRGRVASQEALMAETKQPFDDGEGEHEVAFKPRGRADEGDKAEPEHEQSELTPLIPVPR